MGHLLDIPELDSMGQLPMAPVDLSATAQLGVVALVSLAFRQGKTLEMREQGANIVDEQPPFIERTLGALLENAVKHTPTGCHIIVDVGEAAAISVVADDGPRIAPSDQELVFHRFWRRDRTAATNSGWGWQSSSGLRWDMVATW